MSHYNPQYFPDPDAFLPDRFLESYKPKAHRFAWRPFERGPRQCTGIELAMDQMRIVLLLTVRWFDFEVVIDKESVPRESKVQFTNWETRIGELAFQIWGLGAGPRFGMPMRVSLTNRG
ncbi:cytochrome p450 domain-containing protein [Cladorrhinum samala]|uniref:Cytochrome p450 domain-containing protein n=1 Tax=Cladorrhinum samala TaxID=585594 RepID=A0AAV9HJS2_9PEZI|nr:cytochrome p450 domain-containing protein [Cladorrhinum samala]